MILHTSKSPTSSSRLQIIAISLKFATTSSHISIASGTYRRVVIATGKVEAEVIDASDSAKVKVKLNGRECWVGRKAILYVYQNPKKS